MTPQRTEDLRRHLIDTLGVTSANANAILQVFEDDAARVVRSTPFSSAGTFPSFKNQAVIQRESRTVELPYFRLLEHDDDVLAYVDQPSIPVKASWYDADGRRRTSTMTADVLVIRRSRVALVETKADEVVARQAEARPGYIVWEEGLERWRCPSVEAYLEPFQLAYEIVTPSLFPATRLRNLEWLGRAFQAAPPHPSIVDRVVDRVRVEPGIMMDTLISEQTCSEGELHVLVAHQVVYVDLDRDDLTLARAVPVYPSGAVARALATRHTPSYAIGGPARAVFTLRTGTALTWHGADFEVVAAGPDEVVLRDLAGTSAALTSVPRASLLGAWETGALTTDGPDPELGARLDRTPAGERYKQTDQAGLDEAVRRFEALMAWRRTGAVPSGTTKRSLQRWACAQKEWETATGDPLVGLCPEPRSGNRTVKVDARVNAIIAAAIDDLYLVPNGTNVAKVVGAVTAQCREAGVPEPHARTVQRRIKQISQERRTHAREGRKAAYAHKPFAPIDTDASAPNGDFPFAAAHLDSTELDLETVHPDTGLPLGRAWIHRLVDGYSGIELARLISYAHPSEGVAMEVLWRCANRWRALPLRLTVDGGSEYKGLALGILAQAYRMEIDKRPTSRARSGAPVERSFGSLDTDLLYQLQGNTQTRKNVRQQTPETNPTFAAVHSISWLDGVIEEYNEIIGARMDPARGEARIDVLQRGLRARHGTSIPHVAVDDRLRFLTMAPVERGGTRRISGTKGFTVGRETYWHDDFARPPLDRSTRRVRAALGDPTWVLVEIDDGYLAVPSRSLAKIRITSPDEVRTAAETRRRTAGVAAKVNREINVQLAGLGERARQTAADPPRATRGQTLDGTDFAELDAGAMALELSRQREDEDATTRSGHPVGTWARTPVPVWVADESTVEDDSDDTYPAWKWRERS